MHKRLQLFFFVVFASWHAISMEDQSQALYESEMPKLSVTKDAFKIAHEVDAFLNTTHTIQDTIIITANNMPLLMRKVNEVFNKWGIEEPLRAVLVDNNSLKHNTGLDIYDQIIIYADFAKNYADDEIVAAISQAVVHYKKGHRVINQCVFGTIMLLTGHYFGISNVLFSNQMPGIKDLLSMVACGCTYAVYGNELGTIPPMSFLNQQHTLECDALTAMMLDKKAVLTGLIRRYFIEEKIIDQLQPTIMKNLQHIENREKQKTSTTVATEKTINCLTSHRPMTQYRIKKICDVVENKSSWPRYEQYKNDKKWIEWLKRLTSCCRNESKID